MEEGDGVWVKGNKWGWLRSLPGSANKAQWSCALSLSAQRRLCSPLPDLLDCTQEKEIGRGQQLSLP